MYARSQHLLRRSAAVVSLIVGSALFASAAEPAGAIDFGALPGPSGRGEQVEVDLPRNLISIAARIVAKQEPEVAKLLESVQSVRVRVVSLDDGNRDAVQQRMHDIRGDLVKTGWQKIVSARGVGEDVAVFVRTTADEAIEGITVTVLNGDSEAVLVNIVGSVRPEQIADIAEALHVPHLAAISASLER